MLSSMQQRCHEFVACVIYVISPDSLQVAAAVHSSTYEAKPCGISVQTKQEAIFSLCQAMLGCMQGTGAASGFAKRFLPAELLHRLV